MRPEQLAAYVQYGLYASSSPTTLKKWGDVHLKNLGEERASFTAPCIPPKTGIHVANPLILR
jgi:predicted amidohydrolase YtcJ